MEYQGPLTENAISLLNKRYYKKDETGAVIEDWGRLCERVVKHVFPVTPPEIQDYYSMIYNRYFLPNSPMLFNAGQVGTLSACFYFQPKDQMLDIMRVASDSCMVQKYGGGVGFDFSLLRPKGDAVKTTHGEASGPVSFMKLYSSVGHTVTQSGRRSSANMGLLSIDHPDIEEFLVCKKKEGKLSNFNISVKITDKFMEALKNNQPFELEYKGKVYKTVNPRLIWNKIVDGAWKNGEPGVLFIDTVRRYDPLREVLPITGTNPCWSGDTKVMTIEGPKTFKELADSGKDIDVYSFDPTAKKPVVRTMRNPRLTGEKKHVIKLTVNTNSKNQKYKKYDQNIVYTLTPDHKLIIWNGLETKEIKVSELVVGDRIVALRMVKGGRGNVMRIFDYQTGRFRPIHRLLAEKKVGRYLEKNEVVHHIDHNHQNNSYDNLKVLTDSMHKSIHISEWNKVNLKLGSANGRYKHGKYSRLSQEHHINHVVVSIEDGGYEDVYNGTVDEFHNYYVCDSTPRYGSDHTGILSANCGEQVLADKEACTLGSINVSNFYKNHSINWELLERVVRLSVRLLDRSIDFNTFPVNDIKTTVLQGRKIGLGIMGWADLLYKLEIKYGSNESLILAEQLMEFIQYMALDESAELAIKLGPFPLFSKADYYFILGSMNDLKSNPWGDKYDSCYWGGLYEKIEKYGLRNATVTTIAPTGSISIIADTSSGIEPNFKLSYQRHILGGKESITVFNPVYKHWLDKNNGAEIPDYFITADKVTVEEHIATQAAFQKYTSNAISKTINLPYSATKEDVEKALLSGYEKNCKGLTVYRDNSRMSQVLESGQKDVPDVLPAKRIFLSTPEGKASLLVVEYNGKPVELFMFPPDKVAIDVGSSGAIVCICRCIAVGLQGRTDIDDYVKQLKKTTKAYQDHLILYMHKVLKSTGNIESLVTMPMEDEDKLTVFSIYEVIKLGMSGEKDLLKYAAVLKSVVRKYGNITSPLVYMGKLIYKAIEVLNDDNGGGYIILSDVCPECGEKLILESGCGTCLNCTFTKCG